MPTEQNEKFQLAWLRPAESRALTLRTMRMMPPDTADGVLFPSLSSWQLCRLIRIFKIPVMPGCQNITALMPVGKSIIHLMSVCVFSLRMLCSVNPCIEQGRSRVLVGILNNSLWNNNKNVNSLLYTILKPQDNPKNIKKLKPTLRNAYHLSQIFF